MDPLKIEILNPKALKLIKGLEELKLIKVQQEPKTKVREYLKRMRSKSKTAPNPDEIVKVVNQVRAERNAGKKGT